MGVKSYVKNTVKNNLNVKGWLSWDNVKDSARVVGGLFKALKGDGVKPATASSFEAEIKRLNLTEAAIQSQMKSHFYLAIVFAVLGLGAFFWGFHLLFEAMFLSSLVAFSLTALMLAYAFREHFYYFQMKQRRLDCTVKEWFSNLISFKK